MNLSSVFTFDHNSGASKTAIHNPVSQVIIFLKALKVPLKFTLKYRVLLECSIFLFLPQTISILGFFLFFSISHFFIPIFSQYLRCPSLFSGLFLGEGLEWDLQNLYSEFLVFMESPHALFCATHWFHSKIGLDTLLLNYP